MRKMLKLAGAVLVVALAVAGLWFARQYIRRGDAPPIEGLVLVNASTVAANDPAPAPALPPANLPAAPDKVIAQVRQAYPLLTDVDFGCDAGGCAVTATIPPPTGDAFLQKRQEMLTGGLARTIEANGYRAAGPVQMDEVAFNTFHIRAAIAQPQGR